MYQIKNYFIDSKGIKYNIKNINFSEKSNLIGSFGNLIAETDYKNNPFFSSSNGMGVYIYKSRYDKNRAFRIYKDFADYEYTFHDDAKLILELQSRQEKINLTTFPMGVVTIKNKIIGQEIPLFEKYKTLFEYFSNKKNATDLFLIYLKIIEILSELYKAEIFYIDIHSKNFLINPITKHVKLIDFESSSLAFDNKKAYKKMLENLKIMIKELNSFYNYNNEIFEKASDLEQMKVVIKKELKI